MGVIMSSIPQTIQFSKCRISDIGRVPPFWTVLLSWYAHYVVVDL